MTNTDAEHEPISSPASAPPAALSNGSNGFNNLRRGGLFCSGQAKHRIWWHRKLRSGTDESSDQAANAEMRQGTHAGSPEAVGGARWVNRETVEPYHQSWCALRRLPPTRKTLVSLTAGEPAKALLRNHLWTSTSARLSLHCASLKRLAPKIINSMRKPAGKRDRHETTWLRARYCHRTRSLRCPELFTR